MDKPTLYLFVGYPGAGKTSVAKLIEQRTGAVHLWADNIRQQMVAKPTHSRAESKKIYDHLNQITNKLLRDGKNVIFDTNFNFFDDRQLLRNIASKAGAETKLIWVVTAKTLSHKRAVHSSENDEIRVYGNMTNADFERIAGKLQAPLAQEQAIAIDGTNLDANTLYRVLGI